MRVIIRNKETGEKKFVSEGTAEMIEDGEWLSKTWKVIPHEEPPYDVRQFQEVHQEGEAEQVEAISSTEEGPAPRDISAMTVRELEGADDFTSEELKLMAVDPRVSVQRLVNKKQ